MDRDTVRLCVVGAGGWSTRMHLPAFQRAWADRDVTFEAVCDRDEGRARRYADALGASRTYPDMATMVRAMRPDGVAIIVPPPVTPVLVSVAAEYGVPFFCEKPPARSVVEHRGLLQAVGDLVHVVGYNRRHAPYLRRAHEWLAGETPQVVSCDFSRCGRTEAFFTTLVHAVDTVRFLAGGDLCEYRLAQAPQERSVNYFLDGWSEGGARVDIRITPDTASAQELYVVRGRHRSALVSFPQPGAVDHPGYVELHEENRIVHRLGPREMGGAAGELPFLGGMYDEHKLFFRAVRGLDEPVSTLATSLQTTEIREAFERLDETGGRLAWKRE